MKKVKWFIPFIILTAVVFLISCGDDESPAGPGENPTASTLSATSDTTNSVAASWTMCPDNNFSEYKLYRSTSSGISGNPPASPVRTTTNISDTTYTDAGLEWDQTYYYAVQTKNTDNNTAWSNEVQVVTPDSSSGGDVYTCYQIQGQQADSPFEGQTVSVTGIVTADPDDYTATSSTYAVLSDANGGPWSGLLMYSNDLAGLHRGDSVTVTGVVDEYFNMTELKFPLSYVIHSSGHTLPTPEQMSTGDLSTSVNPEQWESVFVTVSDVDVTQIGLPYYTWAIDDGSGECYAGTMGDFSYTPVVGNNILSMTGVLWYSRDNFKIQPRDDNDLIN